MGGVTQVPEIFTFQYDQQGVGGVANSVNLFRGDLNFPMDLITLPGRNGLDAKVTILYESNVAEQAQRWNFDGATGILGLGWNLALDRIIADVTTAGTVANPAYFLMSGTTPMQLVQDDRTWLLFTLTEDLKSSLQQPAVTAPLVTAFAAQGLALTLGAPIVTEPDSTAWQINDAAYGRCYRITSGTSGLPVYAGGLSFQTPNFQFWRILYYPAIETWEILKPDGLTYLYGGSGQPADRNLLTHGVRWGNWIGSSMVTQNSAGQPLQQSFVDGWNLGAVRSKWMDQIMFDYDLVTQPVGDGGLSFTKACYLKRMTDVFGRTAELVYGEKEYNDRATHPELPREYLDPQLPAPTDGPSPYQSKYETRYLDQIQVANPDGVPLFSVLFQYTVANVTNSTGTLYGDTYKRYLTGVVQVPAGGAPQPGLAFTYYLEQDSSGTLPLGALESITFPGGAVATYSYSKLDLDICPRKQTVPCPAGWSGNATPRVWFGPDYAVVTWLNANTKQLQLQVFTWLGNWQEWRPAGGPKAVKANPDDLQVLAEADYFLLFFPAGDGSDATYAFAYHKQTTLLGSWEEYVPPLFPSRRTQIAGGAGFFLASNPQTGELQRFSWQWPTQSWLAEQVSAGWGSSSGRQQFVVAAGNYYQVMVYETATDRNTFTLYYQDPLLTWFQGGSVTTTAHITFTNEQYLATWSPGRSLTAFASVTSLLSTSYNYTVQILQWSDDCKTVSAKAFSFSQTMPGGQMLIGFAPVITGDEMVATGPNLLRYDGLDWHLDQSLAPSSSASSGSSFYFAYGVDLGLGGQSTVAGNGSDRAAAYDPTVISSTWVPGEVSFASGTVISPQRRFYVTAAQGGYFTSDLDVYRKDPLIPWSQMPNDPIYTLSSDIDTTTIVNQGPEFMTYLKLDGDYKPVGMVFLTFWNGQVRSSETVAEQYFLTTQNGVAVASNGRVPAGPSAFVTYPLGTLFNQAPVINLYRYAAGAIDSSLHTFVVSAVSLWDGYQTSDTSYAYDPATAASDPTGKVAKFYQASTFSGELQPAEVSGVLAGPNGRTVNRYFNGVQAGSEPFPANASLLDGLLIGQDQYDAENNLVASSTTTYTTYTAVLPMPPNGTQPVPLYGGLALPTGQTTMLDGVTSTLSRTFDLATGNPVLTATDNYNSYGQREVRTNAITYAYTAYPDLPAWQVQNLAVQTRQEIQADSAPAPVVVSVQANTLRNWPLVLDQQAGTALQITAPYQSYSLASPQTDSDFPFQGTPGTAWMLTSAITARGTAGLVTEVTDADGMVHTTLYDARGELVVAGFTNASLTAGTAAYAGFEPYEAPTGWSLPTGSAVVTGTAHTGTCSVQVNPGAPGPTRLFQPQVVPGDFLFTCWAKVAAGSTPAGGWTVTVKTNGVQTWQGLLPFGEADGTWRFLMQRIPVAAGATGVTITISAANDGAGMVWLDDLRFTPFVATFLANVYDPVMQLPLATLGNSDDTMLAVYSPNFQKVGGFGPQATPQSLVQSFLSRQTGGEFNPAQPNQSLALTAAGGGFLEQLNDPDQWQRNWTAAPAGAWQVEEGVLTYSGATPPGSLALRNDSSGGDLALYLTYAPAPGVTLTQPLGIRIGDAFQVAWSPASQVWTASYNGQPLAMEPQSARPTPQAQWLLVNCGGALLFYANGQLILRYLAATPIAGTVTLYMGNPGGFRNLAVLAQPQVSVSFADGTGRSRQLHSLGDGESIITATLYDDLGRPAVQTKGAAFALASDPTFLSYRPGFITSFDWSTGVMQGDIADYYSGQEGRSNDQGYPYSRTRFEASPMGRPVEYGKPGKLFAIAPDVQPPHTTRISYGANVANDLPALGLPAGQYRTKTVSDPNQVVSASLTTQAEEPVAQWVIMADGTVNSTALRSTPTSAGVSMQSLPPNAFPASGGLLTAWQAVTQQDLLGRTVTRTHPDTGTQQLIYDRMGRLRFSQDAAGAAGGYILYARYDGLGRLVEGGQMYAAWNPEVLQPLASDSPDYPTVADGAIPLKQMSYDGDGSDPHQYGRLAASVVLSPDGTEAVVEQFRYDAFGRIQTRTLQVPAYDSESYSTQYTYNNNGDVVTAEQNLPAGSVPKVIFGYDRLGHTATIAVDGDSQPLATYTYDPNGAPLHEVMTGGNVTLDHQFTYTSPGWLAQHQYGSLFSEQLSYTSGGAGGAGYYDGKIARVETAVQVPNQGDFPLSYSYAYAYDNLGRMEQGESSTGTGDSLSISRYDGNGNTLQVDDGGQSLSYAYQVNTDKVLNTDGSSGSQYGYEPDGNISSAAPRQITGITYHPLTRSTTSVQMEDGGQRQYQYDSSDQRVFRLAGTERKLYLRNPAGTPLVELVSDGSGTAGRTQYLSGPLGMVSALPDGARYLVLRDYLNSTRMLLDATTGDVVQAIHYKPFGSILGDPYGGWQLPVPYLYTAQEIEVLAAGNYLYAFGPRLYDSRLMRFYGTDPQGQYASPYVYAGNNPVLYVDPSGEFAFLALAIAVGISALIGAAAGGITYAVQAKRENQPFSVGKFFAYMGVGALAGAAGGAVGYGVGAAVAGAMAAAGVATYSTVATGIVVGATAGAADGAISGAGFQIGANLVDGNDWKQGVGQAALIGGAIGLVTGGVMGGLTGAKYAPVGRQLARDNSLLSMGEDMGGFDIQKLTMPGHTNALELRFSPATEVADEAAARNFLRGLPTNEPVAISSDGAAKVMGVHGVDIDANRFASIGQDFGGTGFDMRRVCCIGQSMAPDVARQTGKPVLAAEGTTISSSRYGVYPERFPDRFHIYFPNRFKTAWGRVFGY